MVKVQKPNPKTLKNNNKKVDKPNGIKKEKPTKDAQAIPASNVTAKKAKTNLIEDEIQKNEFKPELKVKKRPTSKKVVQQEEPKVERANKKKGLTKEHSGVLLENVETKPSTKKSAITPENDLHKEFNQVPKQKSAMNKTTFKSTSYKKKTPFVLAGQKPNVKFPPNKEHRSFRTNTFRPQRFNVTQFYALVNARNIKRIAADLKRSVENRMKEDMPSKFRYLLNVGLYYKTICNSSNVVLNLKHSLVDMDSVDVVVIVQDLPSNAKVDFEPTKQHYEGLFREAGFAGLKVVPFSQMESECTSVETFKTFFKGCKYFMCDSAILSQVIDLCETFVPKTLKTFHAVTLTNPKSFKRNIEHALKRTDFKQTDSLPSTIPVGSYRHTFDQLAENILFVLQQLAAICTGGLANIRLMNLKYDFLGSAAAPLYANFGGAPAKIWQSIGAHKGFAKYILNKTKDFPELDEIQLEYTSQIWSACIALLQYSPVTADKKSKNAKRQEEATPEPESKDDEEMAEDVEDDGNDNDDDEELSNDDDEDDGNDNDEDDGNDDEEGDNDSVESDGDEDE